MNERVKYLSPKETKLDTALVEEAADWSQVHKHVGMLQEPKQHEKNPVSVLPKSFTG